MSDGNYVAVAWKNKERKAWNKRDKKLDHRRDAHKLRTDSVGLIVEKIVPKSTEDEKQTEVH